VGLELRRGRFFIRDHRQSAIGCVPSSRPFRRDGDPRRDTEIFGASIVGAACAAMAVASACSNSCAAPSAMYRVRGFRFDDKRSPGNKEGGLTKIIEKCGRRREGPARRRSTRRLITPSVPLAPGSYHDTPGYDSGSLTGLDAGGGNLIAYTGARAALSAFRDLSSKSPATPTPIAGCATIWM